MPKDEYEKPEIERKGKMAWPIEATFGAMVDTMRWLAEKANKFNNKEVRSDDWDETRR